MLFMFTLVQNSDSLDQIIEYILLVHTVFNSKLLDYETVYAIQTLMSELRRRNLSKYDIYLERTPEQKQRDVEFDKILAQNASGKSMKVIF